MAIWLPGPAAARPGSNNAMACTSGACLHPGPGAPSMLRIPWPGQSGCSPASNQRRTCSGAPPKPPKIHALSTSCSCCWGVACAWRACLPPRVPGMPACSLRAHVPSSPSTPPESWEACQQPPNVPRLLEWPPATLQALDTWPIPLWHWKYPVPLPSEYCFRCRHWRHFHIRYN